MSQGLWQGREGPTLCCPSWGSTGRCIGGVWEAGDALSDTDSEWACGAKSCPMLPSLVLATGEGEFCLFMRVRSSTCRGKEPGTQGFSSVPQMPHSAPNTSQPWGVPRDRLESAQPTAVRHTSRAQVGFSAGLALLRL